MIRTVNVTSILLLLSILLNAQTTNISNPQSTTNPAYNINEDSCRVEAIQQDSIKTKNTLDSLFIDLHAIRSIQEHRMEIAKERLAKMSKEEVVSDTEALYSIKDNTEPDFWANGWNCIALIALIASIVSAIYTVVTFREQKQTELHTSNAPVSVQQWKLKDLPRHFYRNLVCTCALILRYRDEGVEKKRKRYPSESNLRKLQTLPDEVVLPIDVDKNKDPENNAYTFMHELKLLFRNYNIEVNVASDHLSRKNIDDIALEQDFDNLLFKPIQLTKSTFNYERQLPVQNENDLVVRTLYAIMKEHFKKLSIVSNFDLLFKSQAMNNLDRILNNSCEDFKSLIDSKEGLDRSVDNLLEEGLREEKKRVDIALIGRQGIKPEDKVVLIKDVEKVDTKDGKLYGIHCYKKNKERYEKYEAIIDKTEAIDRLCTLLGGTKFIKGEFKGDALLYPGICFIQNEEQFLSFYNGCLSSDNDESKQESIRLLYGHIAPYLNYLYSDKWEFHSILKYILAIDASIEYDRIGMVNYS